jgi:hypothetical protein
LSLSISKDKENDSDKECLNEGSELKEKSNRMIDQNTEGNYIPMNDFSKSGTFKSQSNANDNSYSNNRQEYYTENPSINNNNSNFNINNNNYLNRYNASNYSNFYKDQSGKNFSETISDLQSIGKEIRNNDSYLDENRRNMNEYENRTMSNLNMNSSSLNDLIKKDLHDYLSNLENKQILRVDANKKNEWVVKFNKDEDEDGDLYVQSSTENKQKVNDTSIKDKSENFNSSNAIDGKKTRLPNQNQNNSVKSDQTKIIEQ